MAREVFGRVTHARPKAALLPHNVTKMLEKNTQLLKKTSRMPYIDIYYH